MPSFFVVPRYAKCPKQGGGMPKGWGKKIVASHIGLTTTIFKSANCYFASHSQ